MAQQRLLLIFGLYLTNYFRWHFLSYQPHHSHLLLLPQSLLQGEIPLHLRLLVERIVQNRLRALLMKRNLFQRFQFDQRSSLFPLLRHIQLIPVFIHGIQRVTFLLTSVSPLFMRMFLLFSSIPLLKPDPTTNSNFPMRTEIRSCLFSRLLTLPPLPFIDLTIFPHHFSLSFSHISPELSLVQLSTGPSIDPETTSLILNVLTLILLPVFSLPTALTLPDAISELPSVLITTAPLIVPKSIWPVLAILPLIHISIAEVLTAPPLSHKRQLTAQAFALRLLLEVTSVD